MDATQLCLIVSLVIFVLVAVPYPHSWHVNGVALGLAFFVLSFLV